MSLLLHHRATNLLYLTIGLLLHILYVILLSPVYLNIIPPSKKTQIYKMHDVVMWVLVYMFYILYICSMLMMLCLDAFYCMR
jgi:hypothetical protein